MTGTTSFAVGTSYGLVTDGVWLLLAPDTPPSLVNTCWQSILAGEPERALLARILAADGTIPDFALARRELDSVRVFARGRARVRAGTQTVEGGAASTWTEGIVPAAGAVILDFGKAEHGIEMFEVDRGRVPAAALLAVLGGAAATEPGFEVVPSAITEEQPSRPPLAEVPSESYDELFGDTRRRTVEDAARRSPLDGEQSLEPGGALPSASQSTQARPATSARAVESDHDLDATTEFDTTSVTKPPSSPTQSRGDDLPEGRPDEGVGSGPTVHGKPCTSGHWSAPDAATCRVCGTADFTGGVQSIRRPALGRLILSTGGEVEIDRPIVVGRAPSSHTRDTQVPALITVAGSEISRSHVEVRPEGWVVVAEDLGSANGTVLSAPGLPDRLLRKGEPAELLPGSVIALSDTLHFVFEVSP